MARASLTLFCLLLANFGCGLVFAHDGPDPVAHWSFHPRFVADRVLTAQLGPDVNLGRDLPSSRAVNREGLLLHGLTTTPTAGERTSAENWLPTRDFTITALASVTTPMPYGAFFTCLQDNGAHEQGIALGYGEERFYVALATEGGDDGNGKLSYLYSESTYETGRLYHVAATYDGATLTLFVNGVPEGTTTEQSGNVLYPKNAPVALGGYRDANEDFPHAGELHHVKIYSACATAVGIREDFKHSETLIAAVTPESAAPPFEFVVKPYLQFAKQDEITVMCETSAPVTDVMVEHGDTADLGESVTESTQVANIHATTIDSLEPGKQYFYRVRATAKDGREISSDVSTFATAPPEETPFSFAVISDTQGNPKVSGKVATLAWGQRPSFVIHAGDLVDTGTVKHQWVHDFFASMHPLLSRVPLYPVLGNHERDAHFYYDYTSLPDPSYYYTFQYGNAQFFMIDTNKDVSPSSEQYRWLEQSLADSTAVWRLVCHHHPMYSSDENDYGNLWKTSKSTHGDLRARQLVPLYDKYDVDIVLNGHIHSYERTWPLRAGRPVTKDGTLYLITGGGGGGLETPAPHRPPFSNHVRRGHHYTMVHINGTNLEYRAFDFENRLFDSFQLNKE